jgi:hypothetical protein
MILISIFFIVVLVGQYYRANELRFFGAKTTGMIYDIDTKFLASGQSSTAAYFSYVVDGKGYADILNYYTPSMRVGDRIDVYYDPDSPGIASGGSESRYVVLGIVIEIGALIAGFFPLLAGIRK